MSLLTFALDWLRRLCFSLSNTLPHVATYTRELPVSLSRMYENAIDGEHLPWLHSDTFAELTLIEQGAWGWRGHGYLQPKSFMTWMQLELRLDRANHRWITTTLRGLGKGTQIITHAIPLEANKVKVVVDFYVPKLPRFLHRFYAKQFIQTYTKLYDQDLSMMSTRQSELDRRQATTDNHTREQIELGKLHDVEAILPLTFEMQKQQYRLLKIDHQLIAHATTCPHMLGPLQNADVINGQIVCPWHGYRFDVRSGKCLSGHTCKLQAAPIITVNEGGLVLASL